MFRILYIFAIGIVGFGHPMTRAKLAPPFPIYMGQDLERVSYMKKSLNKVIADFRKVHGDKYDYSLITEENYIDTRHPVQVICRKCGAIFTPTANNHLNGTGCPECARRKKRTPVYGIGINDSDSQVYTIKDGKKIPKIAYKHWFSMMSRCYGKVKEKEPSYIGCVVCDEWLVYSNFKEWFDKNYIDGYHLDKDILVKGNKIYSPETCCFVPKEINNLLNKHSKDRGELPIGVTKSGYGFAARLNMIDVRKRIGYFKTPYDAFCEYKKEKESYIKKVAKEYYDKGAIGKNVYDALMNYKVEITD